jgi:quercetin dioxygenase-like cupin family protein
MIDVQPIQDFTYDGTTVRVYLANKGEGLSKHQHLYSHGISCLGGSCVVRKEKVERVMQLGSDPLNLVANEWHEIEALEDSTTFITVFAEGKY